MKVVAQVSTNLAYELGEEEAMNTMQQNSTVSFLVLALLSNLALRG